MDSTHQKDIEVTNFRDGLERRVRNQYKMKMNEILRDFIALKL